MDLSCLYKYKKVLLLQSQFIFFWRLAKKLKKAGVTVYKINFNGGDWVFYPFGAINYTKTPDQIYGYLYNFVKEKNIEAIVVFNDCKPVHTIAKQIANSCKVDYFVFEQGYIRPDYITFEKGGVNGFSSIPKDRSFYEKISLPVQKPKKVGHVELYKVFYAMVYFVFFYMLKPFFKASAYSVPGFFKYSIGIAKGWILNKVYKFCQSKGVEEFLIKHKKNFYFVPLQMSVDSQIRIHSPYRDLYEFIDEVIKSFSKYAPQDSFLVFKHHPADLGLNNYSSYITTRAKSFGVLDRVRYFKTGCTNLFIENCIGCVTVNSTVGMTALIKGKPVKTMGKAVYSVDGITYQASLDNFWKDAFWFVPDRNVVEKFISYIIAKTQINGSFYKKVYSKVNYEILPEEKILKGEV